MNILEVERLERHFGGRDLWRGLSFVVRAGESLAIKGPTGSGKTLLLRALAGLDALEGGSVQFRGKPQSEWEMPEYRAQVMYLPQRSALPEGRVEAALRAPFKLRVHRGKHYSRERTLGHLGLMKRGKVLLESVTEDLSGGESQIVALLRALQLEPAILLLDEPTASLDDDAARCLEELVKTWLKAESDRACIWTSHNVVQLERVTDRQIDLDEATL